MESVLNNLPLFCTLIGAVGVLFAIMLAGIVKKAPAGSERMQEIAGAIKEGAIAYLNRQLKSMGTAGIIILSIWWPGPYGSYSLIIHRWPCLKNSTPGAIPISARK